MKKLKQRVTLKRRRRNKMRHSHKMQQGGIGLMKKLSNPVAAYQLSRENKEKEGLKTNQIIELPENTDINDLIRIADKNLSPKIYRDASDIMIRTKKELAFTDWRNWGKEDTKINKNLMHYFTAYNKIAQILTLQKMKQLTIINDNDPAKINNSVKPLFDFFCEYIIVIGHILESIQEQQNKYNILKILYDHRNNGTLKDAIKDTQLLSETEGLKNMSLKEGIKKYSINTLKLELGSTEEKLIRLNDLINKNNEDIAAFNTGIGNAQSIITDIDQGECVISGIDMSIGKSNVIFDSANASAASSASVASSASAAPLVNSAASSASAAPVVVPLVNSAASSASVASSVNSNASLPLVNSAASAAPVVVPLVNSAASSASVAPNVASGASLPLPLVNVSAASVNVGNGNSLTEQFLKSIKNKYDITSNQKQNQLKITIWKWLKTLNTSMLVPELKKKTGEIFNDLYLIYSKMTPEEKEHHDFENLAAKLEEESQPGGGKKNRKRKQRGGGKDEILNSLNKFVADASQQIEAQSEAGVVDNPMVTQTTNTSKNHTGKIIDISQSNQPNISSMIPSNQSHVPVFATSPLPGSHPANYGTMEQIIAQHDAANAKQTALLIAEFNKLADLIGNRLQGSRGTGEMGTGTETNDFGSDSRSVGSNEESGEESKGLSIKLGDLSKLTGDTYVQSVRYLKLLKAIVKKQPDKDGSGGVMTAIDTALELLQALIENGGDIIKIDETTKGNLETDNADIVEILFSLLGIGVTTATLGGKRKRKCKRCTRKRMKYRRDKKDKKKTQKKALDYK